MQGNMKLHLVRHIMILPVALAFIMTCRQGYGMMPVRNVPVSADTVRLHGIRAVFNFARAGNDSLTLCFTTDISEAIASPDETLTFTPVLVGHQHRAQLPPIIVNGRNRNTYYKRERVLDYQQQHPRPYKVINFSSSGKTKCLGSATVKYYCRMPFASWMGNAALRMIVTGRECCEAYPLDDVMLCADLNQKAAVRIDTVYVYRDTCYHRQDPPQSVEKLIVEKPVAKKPQPEQEDILLQQKFVPAVIQPDSNSVTFRLWFRRGERQVVPFLYGNGRQIDRMRSALVSLGSRLRTVRVISCTSPEGTYISNEELTRNRGGVVMRYLLDALPSLPVNKIEMSERVENWEGLEWLLENSNKNYKEEALSIIRNVPIFMARESRLMDLWQGYPYKDMFTEFFPLLRYADITFIYE